MMLTGNKIGCKTLFSTHYHELTKLEKELKHLKNKHVSATESKDGEFLNISCGSCNTKYKVNLNDERIYIR